MNIWNMNNIDNSVYKLNVGFHTDVQHTEQDEQDEPTNVNVYVYQAWPMVLDRKGCQIGSYVSRGGLEGFNFFMTQCEKRF